MNASYDHLEIYCPQLGMMMTFQYCRRGQTPLPCRNLIGCWEKRIPVDAFLGENFARKDLEAAFGGLPKTKLERIFDSLVQIKKTDTGQ
jgi:hypothetical protein